MSAETLPEELENWITEAVLTEKCSQEFAIELRERLLEQSQKVDKLKSGVCPQCNGFGIVTKDDGNLQEGCELCAGTGSIHTIELPGEPRTSAHARPPR